MKTNISYKTKAQFYRRKIGNKAKYLKDNTKLKNAICLIEKEFESKSPLLARASAFDFFQSIVDVLYDDLEKEYNSDQQARIDLQKFFNSGNDVEFGSKQNRFKMSDDIFNGIFVYIVIEDVTSNTKKEIQIHSLNYLEELDGFDESIIKSLDGLIEEIQIYQENKFPIKGLSLKIKNQNGKVKKVLKTPYNWN